METWHQFSTVTYFYVLFITKKQVENSDERVNPDAHLLHFFEAQAACPNDIFIHPGLWVEGGHVKAVRDANVTAQRSSPRDSNGHIASLLCRFPPQLYSTHIWLLIFP